MSDQLHQSTIAAPVYVTPILDPITEPIAVAIMRFTDAERTVAWRLAEDAIRHVILGMRDPGLHRAIMEEVNRGKQ